jgi:hypothetical protein
MALLLRPRYERPRKHGAAEHRDELAASQLIELHSVPSQGRIADLTVSGPVIPVSRVRIDYEHR